MAGRTRNLNVVITGDTSGVNRAFRQVDTAATQTETRMSRWGKTTSTAFKVAGAAAGGALVLGLKASTQAAIEAEKSQARLETQLKASGISYRAHAKEIDAVIQKTSQLSGLDDEDLADAFTNIVRVTGDVNKSLRLTGLAADFARAKHMDVAKAGELVGKVAGGNIGILSRYGIQIEKGATSTQALGLLQQKFAGQAAAYGRTTAGSVERIQVASENLQEAIGSALLPTLTNLANGLARIIGWLQRNRGATTALIAVLATAAASWAAYTVAVTAAAVATTVATGGITLIVPALAALSAAFVVAYRRSATFRNIVNDVWNVMKIAVPQILLVRTALAHVGDAFNVARTAARGVGSAIQAGIIDPFNKIVAAGRKVASVLGGVKSAIGSVGSVAGSIGGALNPFGDGLGKVGSVPSLTAPLGTGPTGGLMGADRALSPFVSVGTAAGLRVSSGKRAAGGRTVSGGISYHGSGEAVDMSGSPAGMMATFQTLKSRYGSRLAELIYTPGGVGIKNGQPFTYTGAVAAGHYDHVHVALDLGRPGPGIGDGPGKARSARSLSGVNLAIDAARKAGFSGEALVQMVAIAGRESRYNVHAKNLKYPDHSIGLWQINQLAHKGRYGSDAQLENAYTNAKAAYALYKAAGLTPWAHAGGPLGGTNVAAARKAVAEFTASGGSAPTDTSTAGAGGGAAGAGAATPSDYEARRSTVDLSVAEAQATPGARDDVTALLKQDKVIAKRMASIRGKLKKGGLSRATRVRLQGELAGLVSERAGIQSSIKDARTRLLPVQPEDSADGGSGGADDQQQQAMIDALNAVAEATKAHNDLIAANTDALNQQTKIATAVQTTSASQGIKYIADLLSGQIVSSLPRPGRNLPLYGSGVAW